MVSRYLETQTHVIEINVVVMYDPKRDFTSLDAWKKARLVKLFFYKEVVPCLPVDEKFNLNTQIRRESISGTANI